MNNIFITGIKGFIGSHLAQHLSNDKNNNIYGLYRSIKYESSFNALKLYERKNITLIQGDINIYNIEEIIHQYDINQIYHLAAKVIVSESSKSPSTTIITNVFGTLNILEAIRKIKIQTGKNIPTFIMSTDKSYGISNKLPYTEDSPLNGLDIYSASKVCEDTLARSYSYNYNLPIVIGRPSNTYGIDFHWSRLIPSLAKSCLCNSEKDTPLILNEGSYNYIREYNYVDDIVLAIELLLKNIDNTRGESYNISFGNKYTTEEVVKIFMDLSKCNKKIEFKKKLDIFKEIPNQYLDSTKLFTTIKFNNIHTLKDGLLKTIRKYNNWFDEESS